MLLKGCVNVFLHPENQTPTFKEERNVKMNKLLALVLAAVMVMALFPAAMAEGDVSLDFEDGNASFVSVYEGMANSASADLAVADYNGGKALKITNNNGKVPYIAFDVLSLLGEKAADVALIEMTMGIENPDGKFYACSGDMKLFAGGELSKVARPWSVYMEKKNPKVASFPMNEETFSADAPLMVVTLSVDNGAAKGAAPAVLYVDDIRFLDADGNVIPADSAAAFAEPEGFGGGADMSNLQYLGADAVELEGMAGLAAGAWAQDGVEMTDAFKEALVPGAVIEISYSSESGDIWVVMPDAAAGWSRIEQQTAACNGSICQISYEQIAAVLGDDVSKWGAMLQCESSGAWEVYGVSIASAEFVPTKGNVLLDGFAPTGAAWTQDGMELTEEQIAMLVPGSVITIQYTSENGDMWIVMPDAAAGWSRIQQQTAACDGSVCQITYDQIAEVCGNDVSAWGTRMQCEASGAWTVFAAYIGTAAN